MLFLLKKNQAPQVLCSECGHLHEPKQADIEAQCGKPSPMFICQLCMKKLDERFEWLNSPKRWARKRASL